MIGLRISLKMSAGLTLLAAPVGALAQDDQVLRGPRPEWATTTNQLDVPEDVQGLVFLRSQDTVMHLDADGQTSFNSARIKLLHANALQIGNIALSWNPAAGAPTIHTLQIHREGEVIDVLKDNEFEVLRREEMLEAAMINGVLTATLRVPDLRIGDELEWSFSQPASDPTLGNQDFGLLVLAGDPPPGRIHLRLSWEEGYEPQFLATPDLEPLLTRQSHALDMVADDLGATNAPKDAPPRYNWRRVLEYTDFQSWNAVSDRFQKLFAEASDLPSDSQVRREAERIAARHAGELERATAALKLVEQQVRYIYIGLNGGNFQPATAEETWQRRYGDCKGKTALLLALLGELQIPAEAVLVSNTGLDDGLDQRLPNPGLFDHVVVRARIDGHDYWLDGTYPAVARPTSIPLGQYRWVLPLRSGGSELEQLPWQPDRQPRELVLYDLDASEGFDAPARITQTTILRGANALVQYNQFSAATRDQIENAFRNELAGGEFWSTVEDVDWRFDEANQAAVLKISGTGELDWDRDNRWTVDLVLPGGGFSPPSKRQRSVDQDQSAPYWSEPDFTCHVTTVRLPGDTEPGQWSFNSAYETSLFGQSYKRAFERRGKEIRMMRVFRVDQPEVSGQLAETDNARIDDFDNSKAIITYDADDNFRPDGKSNVPATDEVDWVSDPAACSAGLAS